MASSIQTRWGKFLEIRVEVAVGVYAGHHLTAALWQPATPDAKWQPSAGNDAKWGGGGLGPGGDPSQVVWVDVTCDAVDLATFRGRGRWIDDFEPGTAAFTLRNESGKYSTMLDHSQQAIPLRVGRRIRVTMRAAGETAWQGVFYGQVTEIDERVAPNGEDTVAVYAADWFSYFAAIAGGHYQDLGSNGDTATERLNHWLDLVEWPTKMRSIDASTTPLAVPTDAPGWVLDELLRVARSDGGFFYVDEAGLVTFHGRDWLTTNPRSTTAQALWWASPQPAPTEHDAKMPVVCPFGIVFDYTQARVINRVQLGTEGHHHGTGHLVIHTDQASVVAHGWRDYVNEQLLTRDQADLLALAHLIVDREATATRRVDQADLSIKTVADAHVAAATRIGDRVRVHYEQPGAGWKAETDAHILGLEWRVDLSRADFAIHTDDAI